MTDGYSHDDEGNHTLPYTPTAIEQDFKTVRRGLDKAWQPALSRIENAYGEAVRHLEQEQELSGMQARGADQAGRQRDALRLVLEYLLALAERGTVAQQHIVAVVNQALEELEGYHGKGMRAEADKNAGWSP